MRRKTSGVRRKPGRNVSTNKNPRDAQDNFAGCDAFAAAFGYSPAQIVRCRELRLLKRNSILRAALLAASLTGVLLLDGCGRAGPPVPLDPSVAAKADAAKESPESADPTANSKPKLPHGHDANALKAGASKEPTFFDFLL